MTLLLSPGLSALSLSIVLFLPLCMFFFISTLLSVVYFMNLPVNFAFTLTFAFRVFLSNHFSVPRQFLGFVYLFVCHAWLCVV